MMKHLTHEEKQHIVQIALKAIKDKKIQRIYHLYMKGFDDVDIMCKLAIPLQELEVYKSVIREKLIAAGYKPKE